MIKSTQSTAHRHQQTTTPSFPNDTMGQAASSSTSRRTTAVSEDEEDFDTSDYETEEGDADEGDSEEADDDKQQPNANGSAAANSATTTPPQNSPLELSRHALTLATLSDATLSELILTAPVSERNVRAIVTQIKLQQETEEQSHGDTQRKKRHSAPAIPTSTLYYTRSSDSIANGGNKSSPNKIQSNSKTETNNKNGKATKKSAPNNPNSSRRPLCRATAATSKQGDDDLTVALCFRILRLSPTLAKMRFKLVPTKCAEHVFWLSLWTILFETLQQEEQGDDDVGQRQRQEQPNAKEQSQTQEKIGEKGPPRDDSDRTIFKLRRQVESQGWTIDDLKSEITQLKLQLLQEQQQKERPHPQSPGTSVADTGRTFEATHQGTWILDQDSQDFLSYPPELKENLRAEKAKRLAEVRTQMRFILDSDRTEDSHGRWSCCGQTTYHATCQCDA